MTALAIVSLSASKSGEIETRSPTVLTSAARYLKRPRRHRPPCQPIAARQAEKLGLVNEVVPLPDLMATARRWAQDMLECAPLSIRLTKQGALRNLHLSVQDAMATPVPLFQTFMDSEDRREGPKAFAERRKPNWQNR